MGQLYLQTAPGVYTPITVIGGTGSGGGASTFISLTDVPATYAGSGGKTVSVKADASGLEFTTPATGGLTTGYHATPSATVSVATLTTTKIPMDTVTFDINSEDDAVNKRWLCKTTGKYLVSAQCDFATGSTGYRITYIYKNAITTGTPAVLSAGTLLALGQWTVVNGVTLPLATNLVALTAGDYIEVFVRHSQGSAVVCGDVAIPDSWLSVIRIN